LRCYAVLASVSRCYPPLKGRLVTCYSPGRHFTHGLLHFLVRLACVRHAASVDSEPGSNSRLKPDVCRRVVGRLPSPHIPNSLQKPLGSTARDGATVQPPLTSEDAREVHGGLSCEIVSAFARIRSLTTGTFNRVVKDRIAFRLSGANSVQANSSLQANLHVRIRLSSKPYNHTVRRKSGQPTERTGFPDVFHIRENRARRVCGELPAKRSSCARRTGKSARSHILPLLKNCAQQYGAFRWAENVSNRA
jgi:hypothetical protein